ncbi:MAG: 2-C-methyl-D-erythritol 4-phosphate cytidylyltransferase [Desulfocapsaceae bacterium]|nr:2-C-methyl-D-erythritol 4-phosphate cytidylyltransferase [Desulfocapsaceae bacterium]
MVERQAAAIIPAAGSGTRMNASLPKQYLELGGKPILVHSVAAFHQHPEIARVIVVVPADRINSTQELLHNHQLDDKTTVIAGGLRRQDSVKAGLDELEEQTTTVLVHDGARPLVSQELISECLAQTELHGAAIAAVPVKDTLKKGGENALITATVDRQGLWQAQTPQAAKLKMLREAYSKAGELDFTDEASLLEHAGYPVKLVAGAEINIKITRPEDLALAQNLLRQNNTNQIRIGHGYDAHRFADNRKLILGGVTITHPQGLAGHSDADVVTHALCDAILGALGKGDIGQHFPDTSAEFKDIYSIKLLERVATTMTGEGYHLGNGDITIICQTPKLASYLETMAQNLAAACRTTPEQINVKATTTEKMGFTGRKEGISCHAVVVLQR